MKVNAKFIYAELSNVTQFGNVNFINQSSPIAQEMQSCINVSFIPQILSTFSAFYSLYTNVTNNSCFPAILFSRKFQLFYFWPTHISKTKPNKIMLPLKVLSCRFLTY